MGIVELVVLCGAAMGGFVSGMLGFGTGLPALVLWLMVLDPLVAAPMVVLCSIIAQLQTLPGFWHTINWRRAIPFIVCGVAGVPLGTMILPLISVGAFKFFVACVLIIYCSYMLLQKSVPRITWSGPVTNAIIALVSGVLGGIAGLVGILPSIWATLCGWTKEETRSVFQIFFLAILSLTVVSLALGGFMTVEVGKYTLIAFPGTVLGAWLGRRAYTRLDDARFRQLILILLMLSGASLLVTSLSG